MSPEKQRIAIAKFCGWTNVYWRPNASRRNKIDRLHGDGPTGVHDCRVPNYPDDLNAMHKAEELLTEDQWSKYASLLLYANNDPKLKGFDKAVVHATARRRAEAFLRTVSKWEDV